MQFESPAQFERGLGQTAAPIKHLRAQQVRGQVAIADAKPGRLAQPFKRLQRVERVPGLAVAGGGVEHSREAVNGRVDIRADEQTPELVVVSSVRDHGELTGRHKRLEAGRELGAAGATRENNDLHRNTSSAAGRMRS